jgi:hypothetical protein
VEGDFVPRRHLQLLAISQLRGPLIIAGLGLDRSDERQLEQDQSGKYQVEGMEAALVGCS